MTPAESAGAEGEAFTTFRTSPAGAAALRDAGYRSLMGQEPFVGAAAIAPTATGPFLFTQEMVDGIHSAWSLMHARNSTLAVIDLSGSMRYPFGDSKVSKIDLVRQLAARAFDLASPRANSSVWFFHTVDGKPVTEDTLPLQRNDTPVGGGKVHSDAMKAQIATVQPGGGTQLYRAVQDAFGEANKKYADGYLNQVLIISDGNNEDSGSSVTLAKLSAYVKANYHKDKPVVVNFFLIDPGELGAPEEGGRTDRGHRDARDQDEPGSRRLRASAFQLLTSASRTVEPGRCRERTALTAPSLWRGATSARRPRLSGPEQSPSRRPCSRPTS